MQHKTNKVTRINLYNWSYDEVTKVAEILDGINPNWMFKHELTKKESDK